MLQLIRDRATGWIAWFIIILICVPFALWGIQEYVSPQGSLTVAEVNDSEIGYYQFQNAYQAQRRQLERMLGQRINDPAMERGIRDETLQRLINDELLVQTVLDNGMRVGDGQLAEAIRELPPFQGSTGFTQDVYSGFLRARGLSAEGFELDLRRSLLGEQLISAIQRSELVTRAETDREWKHRNRVRHYRRMVIAPASLNVDEPQDEAVASYFESHTDRYVKPERVKIAYIEIARAEIVSAVPVEEQELRAIYETNRANYKTDEQREARHILVQLARDADDDTVAQARAKIDALRARIGSGEDFAEVAKENSDDPGSASSGGSLGFFGRQVMDPAFEETAFGLVQGVLSEPVRSSFGWHLIEVTGIQEEKIRDFDSVRQEIEAEYRNGQAESLYAERVEELANLAFEHPESLEVAAEALAAQPATSRFFARSGEGAEGIAGSARVRDAAFSIEVLEEGNNSELLELEPGRVAVIRVLEREAARPLALDEAKERIRAGLLADARAARAAELGEEILSALNAGAEMDQVASDQGQVFQEAAQASPANPGALDRSLQSRLFSMPAPPSGSSPAFVGMAMDSAGYQILALLKVQEVAAEPTADEIREARGQLEGALGAESFDAVIGSLRSRADVRVFEETLNSEER